MRGRLYTVSPSLNTGRREIEFEGWTFAADAVDSTIRPPLEFKKLNLRDLAERILTPLGISIVFDVDEDPQFSRVDADPQESAFQFLADLARQRGVLITSTAQGKVLFTRAASGAPVATIFEDFPPFREINARFDGRERFYTYRAMGQSPKKNSKVAIAKDDAVPATRYLTFSADDATAEDLQKAAEWQRSKQLADALTIPFPVSSWYDPNGNLWKENTIVTVVSPSIFVPNGYDFLIRSVEYLFEPSGISAVLNLVPPQVFTGEPIVEPWLDGITITEV
jgi:prophage tail gpP-like protein